MREAFRINEKANFASGKGIVIKAAIEAA